MAVIWRQGIPEGITREDVEQAVRDFEAGVQHSFGPSSTYDLVFQGRHYPPKGILGLAARRVAGRTLGPNEFSGGRGSRCFKLLQGLGFEIVEKDPGGALAHAPHDRDLHRVFEDLVPDPDQRKATGTIFADSITEAHELSPGAWVLSLGSGEPFVRLDVGRVFALTLRRGQLALLLDAETLKPEEGGLLSWDRPVSDQTEFKSLPGMTWRTAAIQEVLARWDAVREAHLVAVRAAAGQVRRSSWYGAHQPGLVMALESIVGRALPRPQYGVEPVDELLAAVGKQFPGWSSFADPAFTKDEVDYKRAAIEKATSALGRDELYGLLTRGDYDEILARLRKVGQSTNLLFLGVPKAGDLGVLYADELDKVSFCREIFELLHGTDNGPQRLDRYLSFVEEAGLPNKWTFPTYFLFMLHPDTEIFIKPRAIGRFVALMTPGASLDANPSGAEYARVRDLAHGIKDTLADFSPRDMVDIQSLIWVWASAGDGTLFTKAKRDEFTALWTECASTYLATLEGRNHLAMYERGRADARFNLERIQEIDRDGKAVTAEVLRLLLPHADTAPNRDRGAWIHIAPAVTKDIREWFEGAGWTKPEDWPQIAQSILRFVRRCVKDPGQLRTACDEFAALPFTKGFQSGILSPILNALAPEHFLVANAKSRKVVKYFTGKACGLSLIEYPEINALMARFIGEVAEELQFSKTTESRPGDLFDAFCHWIVAVKKHRLSDTRYWKVAPGEGAWNWENCKKEGYIGIGWVALGDLSGLSRAQFEARRDEIAAADPDYTKQGMQQAWQFARSIKEGDYVIANRGTSVALGIGVVQGSYYFVEGERYPHRLPVSWLDGPEIPVTKPAWIRTLVEVPAEEFNQIISGAGPGPKPPPPPNAGWLSPAFEVLLRLHAEPTRQFYQSHRDEIEEKLEAPFKKVFEEVVAGLPAPITEMMETSRNVFARILKNDWGRGGAWDFYWGAMYPKGGRRIEDAQLFIGIHSDRLEFGFYIGEYGSDQRQRFLRNCKDHRGSLASILSYLGDVEGLRFGARPDGEEGTRVAEGTGLTLSQWLEDSTSGEVRAAVCVARKEVDSLTLEALVPRIINTFSKLFPLVHLAAHDDPLPRIREYLAGPEPDINPNYSIDELAAESGFSKDELERWLRAIERKGQAIVYGPPGTGKTFLASRLAKRIVSDGAGFVETVQFHPSYAYEDFVEGIRPQRTADGTLDFRMIPGRFLDFCARAAAVKDPCVLIIDEINRASLSKVFGELMYLLEYRDQDVPLAGGSVFRIPSKVRMIGTMNTADRSIALVDHALRRRFAFLHVPPNYEVLRHYHDREETGFNPSGLIEILRAVNASIGDPHYEVGISYFLRHELDADIEDIWRMEIEPYLVENFFDKPGRVEQFRWDKVRDRIAG